MTNKDNIKETFSTKLSTKSIIGIFIGSIVGIFLFFIKPQNTVEYQI